MDNDVESRQEVEWIFILDEPKAKKEKRKNSKRLGSVRKTNQPLVPLPPFLEAARNGDLVEIKRFVEEEKDTLLVTSLDDSTALHLASLHGHFECVQKLLEVGAQVNTMDRKGFTPLHNAVTSNNQQIITMLINGGANLTEDKKGNTPFHHAAKLNHLEALKALMEHSECLTVINIQNIKRKTSLHLAAVHKDGLFAQLLLSFQKIQVCSLDEMQRTPLHIASLHQNEVCVKLLLERMNQSEINTVDVDGNTALHLAAKPHYESINIALLRSKIDVNAKNNDGKTALHIATECDATEICSILTSNGADVSIVYSLRALQKKKIDEEEVIKAVSSLDSNGFLEEIEERKLNQQKKKNALERKRALKWSNMANNWEDFLKKKGKKKLKKRITKGLPESLRGKIWENLVELKKNSEIGKSFQDLCLKSSKWTEQIDLDINRSFRTHIQYNERYGVGQISLFNVLKAYSNYDGEVGYCQGMSDLTAFFMMYIPEEKAFWLLVNLLNNPKYNLRPNFMEHFPGLHESFWIFDSLLKKKNSRVFKHLKKEGVTTQLFAFHWFMLIFIQSLPFNLVLRVWDLFLLYGYEIVYAVALTIIKTFEGKILVLSFEKLMGFFRDLSASVINADQFIQDVMKQRIKKKKLQKLSVEYQRHLSK